MPELPEVETTVQGLRKTIAGLVIKDVWTDLSTKDTRKKTAIGNPMYFRIFKKQILGKRVASIERRAKNILIHLSGKGNGKKTILIHMKMTGHLLYGKYKFRKDNKNEKKGRWIPDEEGPLHNPFNRFIHVVFGFSNNKHLAFSDSRKFGKITLLDTETAHNTPHLINLGPEPLLPDFDLKKFKERINKKPKGKIKTVLMDQRVIAGIGNIYSDEILWRAGIHPERKISDLREREIKLMFEAIKETLSKGIDFGGDSMSDYRNIHGLPGKFQFHHEAYRRTGEKCRMSRVTSRGRKKNCNGIIERKVVNGRSAHFCSKHQAF